MAGVNKQQLVVGLSETGGSGGTTTSYTTEALTSNRLTEQQ